MTLLFPHALNNTNTEQKNPPKPKLMHWKKIIKKPTDNPCQPALGNLGCSTPGSLFKDLCRTVFSRKPHHLPSQWVTGVSQNHRPTFQAKFIFKGSSHYSESGRTESTGTPRSAAVSQELLPPAPASSLARQPRGAWGGTRAPAQQHRRGFMLGLLQFSCLFA